jgi:DNA-binding response OmpR family regulator
MRPRSTTVFYRTLPIMVSALSSSKPPDRGDTRAGCADSSKPLALVVEDHEDTRFLLKYLLMTRGFDVLEAENGEEAIDMAERLCPSLILMDGWLPRLDGLSATRRMRELATLREVPIIFLSSHAEPVWQVKANDAGCDDYLVKPFDIARLDCVLARYLHAENSARGLLK